MSRYHRVDGPAISTNPQRPLVALLEGPAWDKDNRQRAKRVNGCAACPDCGLLWPCIEEIGVWSDLRGNGKWYGIEWDTGTAFCEECEIAIVGGFDCDYVIRTKEQGRDS